MPLPESELVSAQQWEVYSPPPLNSFKGSLIPRAFTKRKRRRKISIEVHRVFVGESPSRERQQHQPLRDRDGGLAAFGSDSRRRIADGRRDEPRRSYEECIIRVLNPPLPSTGTLLDDGDDDDSSTLGISVSPEFLSQGHYVTADYHGWKLKWRFPVSAMSVKGWHGSKVIVQIRLGSAKVQLRELIFDSQGESERFRKELGGQHEKEDARRDARLRAQLGERGLLHLADQNEQLTFLVEVVSGWNLPVGDVTTSDPFVKVSFNGVAIHETKHISKTCVTG
jgi:hypothetical protein